MLSGSRKTIAVKMGVSSDLFPRSCLPAPFAGQSFRVGSRARRSVAVAAKRRLESEFDPDDIASHLPCFHGSVGCFRQHVRHSCNLLAGKLER